MGMALFSLNMDLDKLIVKMEADLIALKRARDLTRQYANGSGASVHGGTGKNIGEIDKKTNAAGNSSSWFLLLPDLLRNHAMSVREIEANLREQNIRAAYSTIYAWMKRAENRGEYAKRGKKYRLKEAA